MNAEEASAGPGTGRLDARLPRPVQGFVYVLVAVVFVFVVVARHGPGASDAPDVLIPTTALSHGQLGAAFSRQYEDPNPPGYALFAASIVAVFRPLLGSPNWCVHVAGNCVSSDPLSAGPRPPPWYRSQALVAVLAWLVLEVGLIVLLHILGRGRTVLEALALLVVALMPATTDTVVSYYHPQDLLSMGLVALGIAAALRHRWLLSGIVLGLAFLVQQFALLALIPVVLNAPSVRQRVATAAAAAVVVAVVVTPFFASNATETIHSLGAAGVLSAPRGLTQTLLAQATSHAPTVRYGISRYGPFVLVAGICLYAWPRRQELPSSLFILGLATASMATRLVFELAAFRYYFLAVSVLLVCLDAAHGRWPLRPVAWIALTSIWWEGWVPSSVVDAVSPLVLLAAAAAAMWIGLEDFLRVPSARNAATKPL